MKKQLFAAVPALLIAVAAYVSGVARFRSDLADELQPIGVSGCVRFECLRER